LAEVRRKVQMAQFDKDRMADLSDEELARMITDPASYVAEAVDFARAELNRRSVPIPVSQLCGKCGKQYWSTPELSNGVCGKCHRERISVEEQTKRKQLLEANDNKEKEWKTAVQNGQVVACSIENPGPGIIKRGVISPDKIIQSEGYFKKAEIGVIGHDIVLRTIIDSVYDQDFMIPLKEIEGASFRVLSRIEHAIKRVLHFSGLGAGLGAVFMIVLFLQRKPVPLYLFLFLVFGFSVGGAVFGALSGLLTSKANEVRLSTASGKLVKIYAGKEELLKLRSLFEKEGVQWKELISGS
jgi:hypothetical protein